MTHMKRSPQIKLVRQGHHVSGVGIHIVPRGTLCRAAVATTVMRDNPVTLREEVEHLVVPVIGTQRPSMVEDNGLGVAGTPVLVEDAGAIRRSHGTHCHSPVRLDAIEVSAVAAALAAAALRAILSDVRSRFLTGPPDTWRRER